MPERLHDYSWVNTLGE